MQTIKLNNREAKFDGVSNSITFDFEGISVDIGFCSEDYSFDLMISDGTEDENYPLTLHNSIVKISDLEEDWPETMDNITTVDKKELLICINKGLNLLNPNCTKEEAYSGF